MAADLSLLFTLKAKNEASATLKQLEASIASVKERIREVKAEKPGEIPFKTERIDGLKDRLASLQSQLRDFKAAQKDAADSLNKDLGSALQTISPRLSGLAGAAGPIALTAIGFVAAAAAGAKLAETIFDLAQRTADFRGKFEDLSQQVGVTVETLSTLDVLASTTGGNIDSVAASLGIFQKNLESAHDPTSKEAKLLKELGVTSLDTETALRQTLKGLFDLGPVAKQTDAVLQLFGRSGRFVNAILKESHGNLDEATEKFEKMGLVISSEAAAAADRFNDSYSILQRQLTTVTSKIVNDTIPVFISLFEEVSEGLTKNKDDWKSWSDFIAFETAAAIASVKAFVQFLASRGTLDPFILFENNLEGILDKADKLKRQLEIDAKIEQIQRITQAILAGRPGDTAGTKKTTDPEIARAAKEASLDLQAAEESFRAHRFAIERERALDLKSIDDWVNESIELLGKHLADQQKVFDQERASAERFIKNRRDRDLALREIEQKDQKAQNDYVQAVAKIQDDAQRKRDQSELKANQQLVAIRDAQRQGEIAAIKRQADIGVTTESAAIQKEQEIEQKALADRLILLDIEFKAQSTSLDRQTEIVNEKLKLEQEFTNKFEELTRRRIDALTKETVANTPSIAPRGIPEIGKQIFDDTSLGLPPEAEKHFKGLQSALDDLGKSIGNVTGASKDFSIQFGDVAGAAIDDLAFGVGNLVDQWVLLGDAGPNAMRKLTASVLAGVASQAAVKAIFQLAEGFASLAIGDFVDATHHFTSAAIFGSIAGVAAIAGRAVAGDLFKPQSGAGGGSANNGQLNPLTLNRNQPQSPAPVFHVDIRHDEGVIVKTWVDDFKNGGRTREVTANDGSF